MNQIKQKIEEIGLSQREISVRLGKNASYLAGVFRTGLSTAKQAELLELLDIVGDNTGRPIPVFNDTASHPTVMQLLDKVIASAEAKEKQ